MSVRIGAALLLALTPLAAAAAPAPAAAPLPTTTEPVYTSAAELAQGPARPISAGPNYLHNLYVRDVSGEAEVHAGWNDVFQVRQGQATILVGGALAGDRVTAPGERRGGTLTGARSFPVGPGDTLTVPAGIPHQVVLAAGAPQFRYIVVKTKP
jgi:mannose-6-phosphate isomerase-like protein (cupin superfamily)